MNYKQWFQYWHQQAVAKRNFKRGFKYNNAHWMRLHPTDPDAFEILQYVYLYHRPATGRNVRVPPAARPAIVVATARADGILLNNRVQFERIFVDVPAKYKFTYPNAQREYGPFPQADANFNNLLATIPPNFYHSGNGSPHKPGFLWRVSYNGEPVNLVGPVYYDANTNQLTAVNPQPDEQAMLEERKRINTSLRVAFRKLKILTTMGVEVTEEELKTARLTTDSIGDPRKFLETAERFDPKSHADTVELCARASCIYRPWRMDNCLLTEQGLAGLRRTLQRKLIKVTDHV